MSIAANWIFAGACLPFAIFAVTTRAQSVYDLSGTDEFHRAYFEENTNEVSFEPFQELNWEAKAPRRSRG